MEVAALNERITKKEEQIKKLEKKLEKLKAERDSTSKFDKYFEEHWGSRYEERKEDVFKDWLERHDYEIRCCEFDLKTTNDTLVNYKNKLLLAQEKESKPVIKIFKDFLENWKKEIAEFTDRYYKLYLKYDHEYCDLWNSGGNRDPEKKELMNTLHKKMYDLLEIRWVSIRRDKCEKDFEKFLNKYMEDRYYELVNKISSYVGEITDVSALWIGNDGRINGVVSGTSGKVKLETIVAGGYNIQCRHYRVLVHKYKEN